MKRMLLHIISTTIVTCLTLFSCSKDEIIISDTNYIMFGHFYGECSGERCIEIFRLETDKLFEDTEDKIPTRFDYYEGEYVLLSQNKFISNKDLFDLFPNDLLKETDTVIGQPDAGDWGGFYLEYNFDGTRRFWLLDKIKNHVPEKYHLFIDDLNNRIDVLQ